MKDPEIMEAYIVGIHGFNGQRNDLMNHLDSMGQSFGKRTDTIDR